MTTEKQIKLSDLNPLIPEEVFVSKWAGKQVDFKALTGQKIGILEYSLIPSEYGEGKYFASIQAIDEDNNMFWFNTSSVAILKKLEILKEKKKLPISCSIVAVKSKAGRTYYDLQ